ncbi:MerR family transcriptional regulator [Rhodohalobacter sp. 8-1]|uniref:MerR family transcriptional regulator n=1 Tax=Rhodohalobacter sp. 8-1 TaxID=3131972 RepID=UPI0030ED9E08
MTVKSQYKIGKAASLAGVNIETIRYYERRNLIPEPDRMDSGYRLFSQRHVDQIRFIKRAQELGFTLSEIDDLLNLKVDEGTSCSDIKHEAEQKYQDVVSKIEDLTRIKHTLTELIDSCSGNGPKGDCPILKALEGKNETGKNLRG